MDNEFVGPLTWAELYEEVVRLRQVVAVTRICTVTGLLTRSAFEEVCSPMFDGERRRKRQKSFLFIDLDHFKAVNDTYGHAVGDQVLYQAGEAIRDCIRTRDLAGRYGGEEFVVLLDDAGRDGATQIAERILSTIYNKVVFCPNGKDVRVTASIGVVEWDGQMNLSAMQQHADKLMYLVKSFGRNGVCS